MVDRGYTVPHRWGAIAGVALAIAGYGLAFGVLARTAGLTPLVVAAMSALAYSGAAQTAFVAGLGTATPLSAATAAVLVNLRLCVYGVIADGILADRSRAIRLAGVHLASDESIALSAAANPRLRAWTYWASGGTFFVVWLMSTVTGAAVGGLITDPAMLGLDAAFPAVFAALLIPMLDERRDVIIAVIAATATAITTPLLPAGLPVVAAIAAAMLVCRLWDE
ncbi:MAG TPA: AzlC family ABC transporter permease [Euzebyales bacterium]|nr:AzlC family ABC transporter permease [Euzebyales bacterium]